MDWIGDGIVYGIISTFCSAFVLYFGKCPKFSMLSALGTSEFSGSPGFFCYFGQPKTIENALPEAKLAAELSLSLSLSLKPKLGLLN